MRAGRVEDHDLLVQHEMDLVHEPAEHLMLPPPRLVHLGELLFHDQQLRLRMGEHVRGTRLRGRRLHHPPLLPELPAHLVPLPIARPLTVAVFSFLPRALHFEDPAADHATPLARDGLFTRHASSLPYGARPKPREKPCHGKTKNLYKPSACETFHLNRWNSAVKAAKHHSWCKRSVNFGFTSFAVVFVFCW